MSSPFSLFRRHQRILMVVTTGLAMISFVLLGAISDPSNMPKPLIVIFLASIVGGLFWLAGLSRGKGTDWGLTGVVIGVAVGLAMIWSGRESSAVTIEGGSLKGSELTELMQNRQIANNFVQMAARVGIPEDANDESAQQALTEASQRIQQNLFGFNRAREITSEDVVLGEILRREADEMGMVISDEVVKKFITRVSGGKLTGPDFSKIRRTLNVSETALIDVLREEILAQETARLLSKQTHMTPQNEWDFYKQLNVKQTAEMVAIPVSSFVNDSMNPSDAELQELLNQYNENLPGLTLQGRPEEGRPGFFQLPKYKVAYLEAVFDDIKETVGEVTDEEIQKRYEDEYLREVPDDAPAGEMPAKGDAPAVKAPTLPERPKATDEAAPAKEEPKKEEASQPAESKEEPKASEEEAPKEEAKPAPSEKKEEAPTDEKAEEETKPEEKSQSSLNANLSELQFVSLQDDEPEKKEEAPAKEEKPVAEEKPADPKAEEPKKTTEEPKAEKPDTKQAAPKQADAEKSKADDSKKPAEEKTKEDTPADEKPADEKPADEKPADEKPADEKPADEKPADEKPADEKPEMKSEPLGDNDLPPAPESNVPVLDDTLKEELRDDILRERTQKKITILMDEADDFVKELSAKYRLGEIDEDYISLEDATKQIKAYAKKNSLEFIETPLLTLEELQNSEDFPIGSAFVMSFSSARGLQTVVDQLRQSLPTQLFSVNQARRFNFGDFGASESRFVFWKTGFKDAYAPETIDDEPAVREQVTKVWKQQQAAPAALERAEEIKKIIMTSDKPMSEALTDETVTGNPESLFLTVRETGEFTMMTSDNAAQSRNPFQPQQPGMPRYSTVQGAEDVSKRFFETVFEGMEEGDVGVAPNRDNSVYYVVRVKSRNPSSPEEVDKMRSQFLSEGQQFAYFVLGEQLRSEYETNWAAELMKKYDVKFLTTGDSVRASDEG